MSDLFDNVQIDNSEFHGPLAELIRPARLADVVGQEKITGSRSLLTSSIKKNQLFSFILIGPPGVGKTTIARLIAAETKYALIELSAVDAGVSELRKVFSNAQIKKDHNRGTILFIDEVHRFNKSQQDSFLPHIENGTICLIGATTENPNFELNSALLSRLLVFKLAPLNNDNLEKILIRCENEMERELPITKEGREFLISFAQGDCRRLINLAELIFFSEKELGKEEIETLLEYKSVNYSKSGSEHFNYISALQKSIRGSDVQGALYWLARMMNAGEDPHYILRRVLRTAYEDIGLADLQAQKVCLNAYSAYDRLGSPEGDIVVAHAVIYLALAPKSNSVYSAYSRACSSAEKSSQLTPPEHLLVDNFLKSGVASKKYVNDHETSNGFLGEEFLPEELAQSTFYRPIERGQERDLAKRLRYFNKIRQSKSR